MKLVLLGTGGLLPTEAAQTACYFLPEVGILLDAGHGLYRLPGYLQTPELDVYLSHAHGDHTSGLDYIFASYLQWHIASTPEPLSAETIEELVGRANDSLWKTRIHADAATLAVVQEKYRPFNYQWRTLQGSEPIASGGVLTHFLLETGTQGFRLDWAGHSLAYITDTIARPEAAYVEKIAGVDVLLHECNGPDRLAALTAKIGHSHTAAVAQVAAQAQAGRLVLIHHSPVAALGYAEDLEGARRIFPALVVGRDGMEIEF